ncbi:OLC1v1034319C1 [Oldenlandia corymbosa var. corymbosa]|nr:OLC1v1034319C1 [Oldenlandia corymbosa var. corymbosa]
MLKNIQRRKSTQSMHVGSSSGSSSETGKIGGEVEQLRKDRSLMMQELAELQRQQRGTFQHMEAVNEKLQAAENRQKQMVSFMAKLLQNPAFVAHLQQMKQQKEITSPRTMRKFLRHHQQQETGKANSSMEGQIVKFSPDSLDIFPSTDTPELNPVSLEQFPELHLQDIPADTGMESINMPSPLGNVAPVAIGWDPARGNIDPLLRGKDVVPPEIIPDCFSSSPGMEGMFEDPDPWSKAVESEGGVSSSCSELWGNVVNYDMPEIGISSGMSDFWNLDPLHGPQSSGVEKWQEDENPFKELDEQAGLPKDDSSNNQNP